MKNTKHNMQHLQRGAVLWVSLVVLLVMTLTGLALVRTTTLGASIAGNLTFKQSATSGADLGLELGLAQLNALSDAQLDVGSAAKGYYASVDPTVPAKELPGWANAPVTNNDGLGNEVRYLIHRLCRQGGSLNAAGQSCVLPQAGSCPGSSDGAGSVGGCSDRPMYRITARAIGPRGTESYVQMTVY